MPNALSPFATNFEINQTQNKLLQKQLAYLQANSPFYRKVFKTNSIQIENIRSVSDLVYLPITNKEMIQLSNEDFYSVDKVKIIDYVTTSGTSGLPVTFVLTENDLERLAYNEYISLGTAGITDNDTIQLTTTLDRCFMAGMAYFLGARKIGAGIIRTGPGIPELQWDSIRRIKPNILIAVPSFILKLIEFAQNNGIDYSKSSIEKIICIGEPIRQDDFTYNTLGSKITEKWNVQLFSTFASTEMSTAFTECKFGHGGHQIPDLIISEILDDNNNPVNLGEYGELTVTTLGMEGMPLLRYKTGDICKFHEGQCECGRHTKRISPIIGRKNQRIKFKGTTIYPGSLKNVLVGLEGINRYLTEVFTNEMGNDEIMIYIECGGNKIDVENALKDKFKAALRVVPKLIFCTADEFDAMTTNPKSRKTVDFIDKRI